MSGADQTSPPWSFKIAVEDIPVSGAHFDLMADEPTRTLLAQAAGLRSLPRLEASFDVQRHGRDGLQVTGTVSATVGQHCIVTLEPLENEVEEGIDLVFAPSTQPTLADKQGEATITMTGDEPPEVLSGGAVDLGVVATEFLLLGIDPYPRKPGAKFESPVVGDPAAHPFAGLAALKKGKGDA